MPRAATKSSNGKGLRVGQRVTYGIGKNRFRALIVEDRGYIGLNGDRRWLLRALDDGPATKGETFELSEEDLKPSSR